VSSNVLSRWMGKRSLRDVLVRIGAVVFHIPHDGRSYLMFRCRKCGWCCKNMRWGSLLLTVGDIRRLRKALGYGSVSEFLDRECIYSEICEREVYPLFYPGSMKATYRGWFLKRWSGETSETVVEQHPCRFQHGRLCSIYESRPIVCRKYPYAISLDPYGLLHAFYAHIPGNKCRGFEERPHLKRKWLSPYVKILLQAAEEIRETEALHLTTIEEVK